MIIETLLLVTMVTILTVHLYFSVSAFENTFNLIYRYSAFLFRQGVSACIIKRYQYLLLTLRIRYKQINKLMEYAHLS